ncbi:tetratricopeptide repeat protein [Roseobacteraceae bacterium S113]
MTRDICTCETSLTHPQAVEAWNGVILAVLSHGTTAPVHLGRLLELAPGFAMAHALKGLSALMLGRRELVSAAHGALADAKTALAQGGALPRERLWVQALEDWLGGHLQGAVARMEAALALNPADTISMKLSHGIRFILGDNHGMRASVEAVMPAHGEDHPLRGYALGCLAFALEETGEYAKAETIGLLGLNYAADDAWGLHAVAHVYDMTHDTARGIALIDGNRGAWDHCNNFRFHVWWHKALLHLDQGEHARVLALYDEQIRSEKTDDYRDFANASSLLVRLELEGVGVGDRWAELADLAEARTDDGCLTFADMHYMLALAGDNRADAAARMTARVARDAQGLTDMDLVMKDPGMAAAAGLAAFGEARYDVAFANLRAAQPRFQVMGGSHAQRDVFERLTIDAGLRAGRLAETETLLQARTDLRHGAEDAFAAARRAQIAEARAAAHTLAAE